MKPAPSPLGAKIGQLQEVFRDASSAVILTHDNLDPDALASAFALRLLLEGHCDTEARVAFSGLIGRAENRAMVQVLNLAPEPLSTLDLSQVSAVALVDTQPGTGNNSWVEGWPLVAVFDHHPLKFDLDTVPFADIRQQYGATATMMLEYLDAADLELPTDLATALFYAIRSETLDLGREAGDADRAAYFRLLEQADMASVARIQRARVPREYFSAFHQAIERAVIYDKVVMTDLQAVATPDIVAEIADFLLRLQGTEWSCCMGQHRNDLVVSLRTTDPFAHAGRFIRRIVAGLGTAGGHGTMAGGQVPVPEGGYDEMASTLSRRLLTALGQDPSPGESLVRS